jgi:hypothetical protein
MTKPQTPNAKMESDRDSALGFGILGFGIRDLAS